MPDNVNTVNTTELYASKWLRQAILGYGGFPTINFIF